MLEVEIKKKLPGFTLDVRFAAESGRVLGLLGASGCGKSMTLKCIAGVEKPDGGRVVLNDRILFDSERGINLPPSKRRVGYLFQSYALFPNLTALNNIAVAARTPGRKQKAAAALRWIDTMGLKGSEGKYPHELSGGQKQRCALARLLASEPEALLLDEPFSALDSYLRWQVELEMTDILRAFRGQAVFVSHSRDEVYRLCDDVCVLEDGHSEKTRDIEGLFRSPGTLQACIISGCKNFSRARPLMDGRVRALDWGVDLTVPGIIPEGTAHIGVRSHYIRPAVKQGACNVIPCGVQRVIDDVFGVIVMLETPGRAEGGHLLRMEMSKEAWAELGTPETLTVMIEPPDVMLLKKDL